jgi:ubiquinone/menaquinone biosynthesis C-methylase UbiE
VRVERTTFNQKRFSLVRAIRPSAARKDCLAKIVSLPHERLIHAGKYIMTKHDHTLEAEVIGDHTQAGREAIYMLGHSGEEIRRLIDQAPIFRPTTERLLRNAGIEQGMRVLDLGCGAGDVSMLAGKLVGPSGSVVGIDPNADTLAVARARAQTGRLPHVTFTEASVGTFSDSRPFDFVVARFVLIYQVDPVAFLRTAARFLRPGGVLALHEPILDLPTNSRPRVELWQQTSDWLLTTFRRGAPSYDAAGRLIEYFSSAGLPQPTLFSEITVGGGVDAPHYAWLAGVARTLLPRMVETGLVSAETLAIDTLESRLRSAVVEARSQIEAPAQVCAWTRI